MELFHYFTFFSKFLLLCTHLNPALHIFLVHIVSRNHCTPTPVSNPQAAFDTSLSSCRRRSRCCDCTSDWLLAFEFERWQLLYALSSRKERRAGDTSVMPPATTVRPSTALSLAFSVATLVWDHKLIPNQGGWFSDLWPSAFPVQINIDVEHATAKVCTFPEG